MLNHPSQILAAVAGILAILGLLKPQWPVVPVAVFLLAVAIFIWPR